ncbi:hypothetical protein LMG10661_01907 [Ralstonia syzygii subsp. syzygii]|nr:hypothetical protein LMG10661_01907 [Ralstonia syzygii subsp. syzygii]
MAAAWVAPLPRSRTSNVWFAHIGGNRKAGRRVHFTGYARLSPRYREENLSSVVISEYLLNPASAGFFVRVCHRACHIVNFCEDGTLHPVLRHAAPGPIPMSRESMARRSLIVLAALILLFEEWIWNAMLRATARLMAHPWIQAAERRLAELEPIEALCAFVLPMLALLPFKLAAIYVLARGHLLAGTAVLMLAKVVSTTLGARSCSGSAGMRTWNRASWPGSAVWSPHCAPRQPGRRCKPGSRSGVCSAAACCVRGGADWWPCCA